MFDVLYNELNDEYTADMNFPNNVEPVKYTIEFMETFLSQYQHLSPIQKLTALLNQDIFKPSKTLLEDIQSDLLNGVIKFDNINCLYPLTKGTTSTPILFCFMYFLIL